jgi:hypothetical protein
LYKLAIGYNLSVPVTSLDLFWHLTLKGCAAERIRYFKGGTVAHGSCGYAEFSPEVPIDLLKAEDHRIIVAGMPPFAGMIDEGRTKRI